jgi:WD40 repeat protein
VAGRATDQVLQHDSLVRDVAFAPDGATVATASEDGAVRIWRVADGALLKTLPAGSAALSVALAPDGRSVAAGSTDGAVRIWDLASGALLRTIDAHEDCSVVLDQGCCQEQPHPQQ